MKPRAEQSGERFPSLSPAARLGADGDAIALETRLASAFNEIQELRADLEKVTAVLLEHDAARIQAKKELKKLDNRTADFKRIGKRLGALEQNVQLHGKGLRWACYLAVCVAVGAGAITPIVLHARTYVSAVGVVAAIGAITVAALVAFGIARRRVRIAVILATLSGLADATVAAVSVIQALHK